MCTLVILLRPGNRWPVMIAANRDERHGRPWKPPGAHWPDRPEIVGGLDMLAGGSWLGLNRTGVVAAALNRVGELGPSAGKRSRGELVLDALDYADAADAAEALAALDARAYRPFNLAVLDNRDAFLLMHRAEGAAGVTVRALPAGLTVLTAMDPDDPASPRVRLYRPRFLAATPPDPEAGDWSAWQALLASREKEDGGGPGGALYIDRIEAGDAADFGTVSSSLIALPSADHPQLKPIWRFASGPPEQWAWEEVAVP